MPAIAAVLWDMVLTVNRNSYRLDHLEARMAESEQDRRQINIHLNNQDENIYLLCRNNKDKVCHMEGDDRRH